MAIRGLTIGIGADTTEFNKELKAMDRNVKATSRQVKNLADSLKIKWDNKVFLEAQKKAQEAVMQTDVKVQTLRKRLAYLEKEGKISSKEYERLTTELTRATANATILHEELKKLNRLRLDATVQKLGTLGTDLQKAGRALAPFSAAAVGVLASISAVGLTSAEAASEITQTASAMGISAEELQKWQYISLQTNRSIDDLRASFAEGTLDISTFTSEFESLGFMTNEQASQLAEFNYSLNSLKQQFINMRNELGAALMPIMTTLTSVVEEKIIPLVRQVAEWLSNLSERQQKMILGVFAVVAVAAPLLSVLGKTTTAVSMLVKGIGGLSQALSFLMAHPIIAIIGIVAALILMLYTTNEKFRESINALVGELMESLAPILETVMEVLKTILKALMPIIEALAKILIPILTMLVKILAPIINLLSAILIPILELLGGVFEKVFGAIGDAIGWVADKLLGFVNMAIDALNWLIGKLNFLLEKIGVTIPQLEHVSFGEDKVESGGTKTTAIASAEEAVSSGLTVPYQQTNISNDYSKKDIKIEVIVQNYAEHVDVDQLVREINMKLAGEM